MKQNRFISLFLALVMLVGFVATVPQSLAAGSPATIELSFTSATLEPADAIRAVAVVKDESGNVIPDAHVEWTSSNNAVAKVSPYGGMITASAPAESKTTHTATITATCGVAVGTITVTVVPAKPDILWIQANRYTLSTSGSSRTATVNALIHDRYGYRMNQNNGSLNNTGFTLNWSISDTSIATIAANAAQTCTVTAQAPGVATLTVTIANANYPDIVLTGSCKITVSGTSTPVQNNVDVVFQYVDPMIHQRGGTTDLWNWSTGVTDGEYEFTQVNGIWQTQFKATSTATVGYIVRLWGGWGDNDRESGDRSFTVNKGEPVTKLRVTYGTESAYIYPAAITGLVDDKIDFKFRDYEKFKSNTQNTISEVKVAVNGTVYPMTYDSATEMFVSSLTGLTQGAYSYQFIVDGAAPVNDINNPSVDANGKSVLYYGDVPPPTPLEVTASISPSVIGYDQNTVLTLSSNDMASLASATVDMTNLGAATYNGGALKLPIDLSNGAISLYVKEGIEPGLKEVPVTIVDLEGNTSTITATVTVDGAIGPRGDFDWDEAVVYFMLTDRFYDGDPTNNNAYGNDEWRPELAEAFHGGDLKGVLEKLDYLEDLGVNTIWITPIVENTPQMQHKESNQFAYHGYWAKDFTEIDPHLGTVEDLDALLDAAHDKGMKIMVDIVMNHSGYPPVTQFDGLIRTNIGTNDTTQPLGDGWIRLPDFLTEDPAVRAQLVEWQAAWVGHKTEKGNSIDFFRVDTAKHVENGAWQALKNAATELNPNFKMIGEDWTTNTVARPYLFSSGMDALLDFDFATRARNFVGSGSNVGGTVVTVNNQLVTRSSQITNYATLGQFLSSHDQDTFLYQYRNNSAALKLAKGMMAASLQLTDKGIPVIYYGEEVMNQVNANAFANAVNNRVDMKWGDYTADQLSMLEHYKKLLCIRKEYSKVFAKGDRSAALAGTDAEKFVVFSRSYKGETLLVGLNTNATAVENASVATGFAEGTLLVDLYDGTTNYIVGENGVISLSIPAMTEGGTVVLAVAQAREPASIELSPEALTLEVGETQTLTATVKDAEGNVIGNPDVTWSSSNGSCATVDAGVVKGVSAGTATITAACGDFTATAAITVIAALPYSIVISGDSNATTVDVGATLRVNATVYDKFGNRFQVPTGSYVEWSCEPASVATIARYTSQQTNEGNRRRATLTGVGVGTVTITATYAGVTGTGTIQVKPPRKIIFQYIDEKIHTYKDLNGNVQNTTLWSWGMGTSQAGGAMFQFEKVNGIWQTTYNAGSIDPCVPGFVVCRYGRDEKNTIALEFFDRDFTMNPREPSTKVRVSAGVAKPFVYPIASSAFEAEGLVLRYREFDSFAVNTQKELEGSVFAIVNGAQYAMSYDAAEDLFKYVIPTSSLVDGDYAYQFKVGEDGAPENDRHNGRTDPQGRSVLTFADIPMNVTASFSLPSVGYDQNAVLKVDIDSEAEISSIVADVSEMVGFPKKLNIALDVRAISVPVKEGIAPGVKTVPVTVLSKNGKIVTASAKITVDDAIVNPFFDWDEAIVYQVLTDKFYDGDNGGQPVPYATSGNQAWRGGDFKGLTMKLDYIKDLGVNTIWISPIVLSISGSVSHGYHAQDFTQLDPHWGTMEDFDELIDQAALRGIQIMVDIVINHSGTRTGFDDRPEAPADDPNKSMIRDPYTVGSGVDQWITAGLPDFKTEVPWVRNLLVAWQTAWAAHETPNGNKVAYFRLDTIKHVEHGTWMALKNSLANANPNFKVVGEYFNGTFEGTSYFGNGVSDGLLDFGFSLYAADFVNGTAVDSVNTWLSRRNSTITNYETAAHMLNNHDYMLTAFQQRVGGSNRLDKQLLATSLQMTIKGVPVVYYSDVIGRDPNSNDSGIRRAAMTFDNYTADNLKALNHYQKVTNIRKDNLKVFAKGDHVMLAGSDALKYMVFERSYEGESIFVGLNSNLDAVEAVAVATGLAPGTVLVDLFDGAKTYTVDANGDISMSIPAMTDGGTAILAAQPAITSVSVTTPSIVETLAANLRVNVAGANLEGKTLTAYLSVDGILDESTATDITSGTALMRIAAAPEVGADCKVVVKVNGTDAQGAFTMTLIAYNPATLWNPSLIVNEDGFIAVRFSEDIAPANKGGYAVKVNGAACGFAQVGREIHTDVLAGESLSGVTVVLTGVKYPVLFPSYSFTFTVRAS